MKKVLLAILFLTSIACQAQTTKTDTVKAKKPWTFRPYFSPGVTVSTNVPTYGMEIGIYTDNIWLATTTEITANNSGKHPSDYTVVSGLRFYYCAYQPVKDKLLLYVNAAGKITDNGPHAKMLIFEPGACVVFVPQKNVGIQWGVTFPISEQIGKSSAFPISTGLGLNIYL